MRNTFLIISLIAVSITFAVIGCTSNASDKNNKSTKIDTVQQIVKGEYLVTIAGCDDCHSPKRMGAHGPEIVPELRFSGYPSSRPFQKPDSNAIKQGWVLMGADLTSAVGPWGMSFAANISSDNTGIGAWKEGQFITALRKGKFKGLETGRNLFIKWSGRS